MNILHTILLVANSSEESLPPEAILILGFIAFVFIVLVLSSSSSSEKTYTTSEKLQYCNKALRILVFDADEMNREKILAKRLEAIQTVIEHDYLFLEEKLLQYCKSELNDIKSLMNSDSENNYIKQEEGVKRLNKLYRYLVSKALEIQEELSIKREKK
ncbi:MAG: hypothetical protein KBT48_02690 [Firmicutes bacterium]|nr:hypothetical protein [Bacillota bacterium]